MSLTSPGPDAGLLELLNLLREEDSFVSGEVLAARVGLSRAGVWKRLNRLKALGYHIEGEPRRGYRLVAAPDKLFAEEILYRLGTTFLRGPIYHFETTKSTNDAAKLLGSQGVGEGALVVAETQTTGRGRLGRFWVSPPSLGIYASLLLRPPLPPTELPQITLSTAVAVVRADVVDAQRPTARARPLRVGRERVGQRSRVLDPPPAVRRAEPAGRGGFEAGVGQRHRVDWLRRAFRRHEWRLARFLRERREHQGRECERGDRGAMHGRSERFGPYDAVRVSRSCR